YPLWGESKWKRLAELAKRVKIAVAMDSLAVAEGISRAAKSAGVEVGIRLEFDTGLRRCGLPVDEAVIDIARKVYTLPGIRWEGISVYPGHVVSTRATRLEDIARVDERLDRLYSLFDSAGIPYPVVSGGNTPAAFESHRFHGVTEIRPGTYVFNDRNTVHAGKRKHYGYIADHPECTIENLSEEHGHLAIPGDSQVRLGDRLRVIPNHICPCINLQDEVYVASGNRVIDRWRVAGRGKSA